MKSVTAFLTDSSDPRSLASRSRRRRWELLGRHFPDLDQMRVLDLGGLVSQWRAAPCAPRSLTVLNLFEQDSDGHAEVLVGDACDPPAELLARDFDLVFSNSVIDQVGGHYRRLQFAETVCRLAPAFWIQTAYRYFPLDAYTLFPMQQMLPLQARAAVSRHWPIGYRHADTQRASVLTNLEVEGLSKTAFTVYFPTATIVTERAGGLVKSLIAVSRG